MGSDQELEPWESELGKKIWKTRSQYFVWLRGCLRSIWSDYPLRKQWKNNSLQPISDEQRASGKFHRQTKKIGQCTICKEWFAGSQLECDHIQESEGCFSYETAEQFLWHCARKLPEDFQLVCKVCHKIKSYSSREGISFELAKVTKDVILMEKDKSLVPFLLENGYTSDSIGKNAKQRRQQAIEILMNKGEEDV